MWVISINPKERKENNLSKPFPITCINEYSSPPQPISHPNIQSSSPPVIQSSSSPVIQSSRLQSLQLHLNRINPCPNDQWSMINDSRPHITCHSSQTHRKTSPPDPWPWRPSPWCRSPSPWCRSPSPWCRSRLLTTPSLHSAWWPPWRSSYQRSPLPDHVDTEV